MAFSLYSISGDKSFKLSHRVLNFVLFSFFVFSGFAEILNIVFKESLIIHISATFFVFYFGIAYYISRVTKRDKLVAHLTIILSFLGIVIFYLFDGGLYCGNGFYILVDIALIVTLFEGIKRYMYLGFLILLSFVLIGFEVFYPELLLPITNFQCVLNTILAFFITVLSSIFLLLFFVVQLEEQNLSIERMSKTDYLTGLLNRRGIWEKLNVLKEHSFQKGYPFSIILADIDDFKLINDRYGHLCGDKALVEIALILKEAVRDNDIIGRWGGEEFIIILPHADFENAMSIAKRIKSLLDKKTFSFEGKNFSITLTMGVGVYKKELTIDKNLSRIDLALYKGKRQGKNRIIPALE